MMMMMTGCDQKIIITVQPETPFAADLTFNFKQT